MPDHIHGLITTAADQSIEKCAQLIKGGFSFAVRKEFAGEIWQEGYHAHRVTSDEDLHSQILYIANNPTRKRRDEHPYVHTAHGYIHRIDPVNL